MRKIFNKVMAGIMSVALIASLVVGVSVTQNVKADDAVQLKPWTFTHQGVNNWGEDGNVGIITSAKLTDTNEEITNFPLTTDYHTTAKQASKGFEVKIADTGWDAKWAGVDKDTGEYYENNRINPWSVQVSMSNVAMLPGHDYTVTFKAHASQKKYAYLTFGTVVDGVKMAPYGENAGLTEGSDNPIMTLGTGEKSYTYKFTNWVSGTQLNIVFMLGAFNAQYDYAGNDISGIVTALETDWSGDVYIDEFTIMDNGKNPNYVAPPEAEPDDNSGSGTGDKPSGGDLGGPGGSGGGTTPPASSKQLAKVKKLKVKNNKKGTIKITWAKVKHAKKYQIKVGKKTYKTSKRKLTVKKLKKGKKYLVKVRAYKNGSYKTGKWAKKKIKIKK